MIAKIEITEDEKHFRVVEAEISEVSQTEGSGR
jgi:hypothetical protein